MASTGMPVCVVRRYTSKDKVAVQDIMAKVVMETVTDYFWAAIFSEVFPQVEYHFMSEEESSVREAELEGTRRHVVGMLGLTKSLRGGMKGWLRHLAVKKPYRCHGIAQRLLDEAIQFSTEHCIDEIELVTTECHYKARELFYKKGFEVQHTYFKYYFNVQQPMYLFNLPLRPPKAELSEISTL